MTKEQQLLDNLKNYRSKLIDLENELIDNTLIYPPERKITIMKKYISTYSLIKFTLSELEQYSLTF